MMKVPLTYLSSLFDLKENPLSILSSCIDEIPKSKIIASNEQSITWSILLNFLL